MELEVVIDVRPTARHRTQPLTRAQVDRCVAVREQVERAVAEALAALEAEDARGGRASR